jgi:hypothetical protein
MSGRRRMRKPFTTPTTLASTGTSSATWSERSRASELMCRISARTSGGSSTSNASSFVLLITSASSSSLVEIADCCDGGITELDSTRLVNAKESTASMIPPATASPNDRPNDPPAELTPAASLTRSSSMGLSV